MNKITAKHNPNLKFLLYVLVVVKGTWKIVLKLFYFLTESGKSIFIRVKKLQDINGPKSLREEKAKTKHQKTNSKQEKTRIRTRPDALSVREDLR